jgi:RNA polymerase sigma-70 factor (ECF subfamily)
MNQQPEQWVDLTVMTDEELLFSFRRADQGQFEELYVRYYRKLYRFARGMGISHEDAEDLTQLTFVKVYEKDLFNAFRGRFKTWIYTIQHNSCIDYLRKSGRRMFDKAIDDEFKEQEPELPSSLPDPATQAEIKELVEAALNALPERERAVMEMYYLEDMTQQEIAEVMGVVVSTINKAITRALRRCRAQFHPDPAGKIDA